jgi:hypothetical protein
LYRHASTGACRKERSGGTRLHHHSQQHQQQQLPPYHQHSNINGSRRSLFSWGSSVRSKTSQFSMANSSRGGSTAAELEWLYNNHHAIGAVATSNSRQSSASYSCMSIGSGRSNYSASVMKTTLRHTLSQYSSLSAKTSTQSRSSTPPDLMRNITNATVRQMSLSHRPPVQVAAMCHEPQQVSNSSPTTMMLMTTTTTTMLTSEQRHENRSSQKKTRNKTPKEDHCRHQRVRPENPIVLQMMEEYCGCEDVTEV